MSTVRTLTLSTALALAGATLAAGTAIAGGPGSTEPAAKPGCSTPIRVASIAVDFGPGDYLGELGSWTANDRSDDATRLSQQLKLQTAPSQDPQLRLQATPSQLPTRVPRNQTYYVQMQGQQTFNKFAAGAALPDLDCIEIECPPSFPSDTRCWRCIETIASPDGGDDDG